MPPIHVGIGEEVTKHPNLKNHTSVKKIPLQTPSAHKPSAPAPKVLEGGTQLDASVASTPYPIHRMIARIRLLQES